MTAKKRWCRKIYSQSQESFLYDKNASISWSSSEEDEDSIRKKPKTYSSCQNKCNAWIKQCNDLLSCYVPKKAESVDLISITTGSSDGKQINCEDSPIISGTKTDNWSPVLTQCSVNNLETFSPVLGQKNKIRKKVKCRLNDELGTMEIQESEKTYGDSPDLFSGQEVDCNPKIIDSDSPSKCSSQVIIDDSQNTQGTIYNIVPSSSRDSLEVRINSNSDETISTIKSDQCLLMYKEPPTRKKRHKKGGLCSQLQKAIRNQKSRVAIWQHEIYLNKSNSILVIDKNLSIPFIIMKQWREFGCTFYECLYSNDKKNCPSTSSRQNIPIGENIFVLLIGFNIVPNITYKVNTKYILYPPYAKKPITYGNILTRCYFNVSKIKKCKINS